MSLPRPLTLAGLTTLGLAAVAATAVTTPSRGTGSAPKALYYSPADLRRHALFGVTLGMRLAEARARLRERGFAVQSIPPFRRQILRERYMTAGGLPIVDVGHELDGDGIPKVTYLSLQEDVGNLDSVGRHRLVIERFGASTHIEETPFGPRFIWTASSGPRRFQDFDLSRECLSAYSCLSPGMPSDCPAHLLYKGSVMMGSFGPGSKGQQRLYLTLRDTSAEVEAQYRGRATLPSRPVCAPSVP